jgi:hypothetical protein
MRQFSQNRVGHEKELPRGLVSFGAELRNPLPKVTIQNKWDFNGK